MRKTKSKRKTKAEALVDASNTKFVFLLVNSEEERGCALAFSDPTVAQRVAKEFDMYVDPVALDASPLVSGKRAYVVSLEHHALTGTVTVREARAAGYLLTERGEVEFGARRGRVVLWASSIQKAREEAVRLYTVWLRGE